MTRPASMREKSSRVLTSLSSRRRCGARVELTRGVRRKLPSPSRASASSSGPSIKVSGVRNSWLTLEKNAVFARSISASASARRRSSSRARTVERAPAMVTPRRP